MADDGDLDDDDDESLLLLPVLFLSREERVLVGGGDDAAAGVVEAWGAAEEVIRAVDGMSFTAVFSWSSEARREEEEL